jgi:hypothetical protein
MLSCEEISKLISESFERKLSLRERFNLRMHVTLCGTCRMFRRFQHYLHQVIHQVVSRHDVAEGDPSVQLSAEARNRIRKVIASKPSSGSEPGHGSQGNGKS